MREIQASEAKTRLPSLLDEVERGETIVITRHGKRIARLVPETDNRQARIACTLAEIDEFRKTMPRIPIETSSRPLMKAINADALQKGPPPCFRRDRYPDQCRTIDTPP